MPRRGSRGAQPPSIEIVAAGDSACLARFGDTAPGEVVDPGVTARVHELLAALDANPPPGLRDLVPAYASLLVQFDPLATTREAMIEAIRRALREATRAAPETSRAERANQPSRVVEIPVRYGGEAGPDLEEVARLLNLSPEEVARRHAGATYTVAFLGFLAGFPYLSGLPPELVVPRLATPRTLVPAGSVALAGAQTGVYPVASPGGWRVIGQTELRLFDPSQDPPARLRPGDRVRFSEMKPGRSIRETQRTQSAEDAQERQGLSPKCSGDTAIAQRAETAHGAFATPATSALLSAASALESGVAWLRVVRPGPLTSVQDPGRWGYARYGVSPSGAADPDALRLGNLLLGNPPDAAALEVTLGGAAFEALAPCVVALTGADCSARVDGRPLPVGVIATLDAGHVLALDVARTGLRAYLCVAGGVAVPSLLGSLATDLRAGFGGLEGRALRAGDELRRGEVEPGRADDAVLSRRLPPDPFRRGPADGVCRLRVLPGPHASSAPVALAALLAGEYEVDSRSDRMGVRLRRLAPTLDARPAGGQIVSEGIPCGAIQTPPDGEPILLLAERQTTGGYLIPAVVITPDQWRVGQLRPGERVRLELATEADALAARRAREAWLARVGNLGLSPSARPADPALLAAGFAEWDEATQATMGDADGD